MENCRAKRGHGVQEGEESIERMSEGIHIQDNTQIGDEVGQ
jgi:hypothetical protein